MSKIRIGLTMRIAEAPGYMETRDALAHDWLSFMTDVLPEVVWTPLPNMGEGIIRYVKEWGLNGFVFSGGNDLLDQPVRDLTEQLLLKYALSCNLPVLGICRGLQLIAEYFGYDISSASTSRHVGCTHRVHLTTIPNGWHSDSAVVNSYHTMRILNKQLSDVPLKVFAVDEQGFVEGAYYQSKKILGLMWHPEREKPVSGLSRYIIRSFFNLDKGVRLF